MQLFINELLSACDVYKFLSEISDEQQSFQISTDTRTIKTGDFYLPLCGENFDGHNFINQAINNGCSGYFVTKNYFENAANLPKANWIIVVEDTLTAYLQIARYIRRKINPKVIGVTGSSGKTTVKELIYAAISSKFKTHKSKLNHNNEIGFCQTLLSMEDDTEVVIIEMGMRGLGEIELLSKYSEPDVAVISNVGTAHIGRLGSRENIAKAKCEITSYLKNDGLLLAFDDDLIKETCEWKGKIIYYGKNHTVINTSNNLTKITYKNSEYEIPLTEEYNIINSIAAIETALYLNIDHGDITAGLKNFLNVGDRGAAVNLKNNITLIKDCYNANPDSMVASIKATLAKYKDKKVYLVLGDMLELGEYEEALHSNVGKFIRELNVYQLITIGERAKYIYNEAKDKIKSVHFAEKNTAETFLTSGIESNSVVLFKASRSLKFEELAENIAKKNQG